jgi:hypothetical protein
MTNFQQDALESLITKPNYYCTVYTVIVIDRLRHNRKLLTDYSCNNLTNTDLIIMSYRSNTDYRSITINSDIWQTTVQKSIKIDALVWHGKWVCGY